MLITGKSNLKSQLKIKEFRDGESWPRGILPGSEGFIQFSRFAFNYEVFN